MQNILKTLHNKAQINTFCTQLWLYSLVCEGCDLAGTRGGGDDVPALAGGVAPLISGQKVKHLVVVHFHHWHLHRVVLRRLLRDQPGSHTQEWIHNQGQVNVQTNYIQISEHIMNYQTGFILFLMDLRTELKRSKLDYLGFSQHGTKTLLAEFSYYTL